MQNTQILDHPLIPIPRFPHPAHCCSRIGRGGVKSNYSPAGRIMKKRTQSKQNATISFGARLFLLVMLASLLSSCSTVLQTPLPTAIATEMPTITLTPEPTATATEMPTATATEMPTPTEIPEKYPIDLEKFYTMPPSYEDVVANPEKYQEAPNFYGETEVAMKWWEETLDPALGEQKELTPNVFGGAWMDDEYRFDYSAWSREKALLSDYPAFYFKHDNKIYLVPVFTFADNEPMVHAGTFAFILYESQNDGYIFGAGLGEIKNIYEGKRIQYTIGIRKQGFTLPDEVENFVMSEYNWAGVDEYGRIAGTEHFYIGVGAIQTILD